MDIISVIRVTVPRQWINPVQIGFYYAWQRLAGVRGGPVQEGVTCHMKQTGTCCTLQDTDSCQVTTRSPVSLDRDRN